MSRTQRRQLAAVILSVIVVVLLLSAAVYLRMHAAPEPARLLPECDGILYANLKPVRAFTNFGQSSANWSADYRAFVEQTGFQFERDLDEVAFAIHAPRDPQHESRYSEVLVGRFDSNKVGEFLREKSRSRESYRNYEIYLIPYEDRVVRVSVLNVDTVAVSNTGDPQQIDHIIDEYRHSALPSRGPRLLAKYHRHVPFGTLAWLITEVAPPSTLTLAESISPLPFIRQLFGGGVVVASARYNGSLLLRAEDFLKDDIAAKDRAEQLQNLLTIYKTTESQTRPDNPDPDLESALNSLKVEQKGERVQVSASVPRGLIEKMFANQTAEPAPMPPSPEPKPKRKGRRR